jgi:hypothetical protein
MYEVLAKTKNISEVSKRNKPSKNTLLQHTLAKPYWIKRDKGDRMMMKGRNLGCSIFSHLIGSSKLAARLDSEIIPTIYSKKN